MSEATETHRWPVGPSRRVHRYLCGFVYFKSDGIFKSVLFAGSWSDRTEGANIGSLFTHPGPVMEETKASSKKGKAGLSAGGAGPALAPKSLGRFSGARGRRMKAEPPNAAAGLRSKSPCPLSLISIYERVQRFQSEERLSRRVCMHTSRRHGTSLFAGRSARFSSRHSRHTTIVLLLFPPATDSQPPRLTLSPCSLERRTARFSGIRSVSSPTATSLFLSSSPFSPL